MIIIYLMKVQQNRSREQVNTQTMAKKVPKLKAEKRQHESYAFREEKDGGKHTNERSSWGPIKFVDAHS